MKKLIAFSAACLAFAAFGETEVAAAEQMLKLTVIDSRATTIPIAISIEDSAANAGKKVSVADIVRTSSLVFDPTQPVKLFVFNHATQAYDRFQLLAEDGRKYWWYMADDNDSGERAQNTYLESGYAFWLVRTGTTAESKVYILGKMAEQAKVMVLGGDKATHTLLGNPGTTALDLSSSTIFGANPVAGDQIHLPLDNGAKTIYQYSKKGYWYAPVAEQTLEPIPAGATFWYVRKAGKPSFEINWTL